jgi:putative effector of murein hydrolase LrgA (UPF0299 family)
MLSVRVALAEAIMSMVLLLVLLLLQVFSGHRVQQAAVQAHQRAA